MKKKDLNYIDNEQEIHKKFLLTTESEKKALLWENHKGHLIKAPLHFFKILRATNALVFKARAESLIELEEILHFKNEIKIMLPATSYWFKSKVINLTPEGELTVKFPESIHFIERRDEERLNPFMPIRLMIPHEYNPIPKDCYDFSLNGASVIFNKGEEGSYKEDQVVKDIELKFGKLNFKFDGVVAYKKILKPFVLEHLPYGHKKIAFQFLNLDEKKREMISRIFNYQKKLLGE